MERELLEAMRQMLDAQTEQISSRVEENVTRKVGLLIENDVTQKINLIFEKLDNIDEKLSTQPTAEELEITNGRIDILEAMVKKLAREVAELKKAQ